MQLFSREFHGGDAMKRMLVGLAMLGTTVGTTIIPATHTALAFEERAFSFQMEQTQGPRGVGVQGYVHNTLPWRITNVRVQVDSIDANATLVASASGWVLGDVAAGSHAYFYVPVSEPAAMYRARVQAFDKVRLETPTPQAP
jgi:hypothetical protein